MVRAATAAANMRTKHVSAETYARINPENSRVMTQFDPIFAALQATGVRYVVVGGVAVNLHGYQRFTKHCEPWATNPTCR